MRVSVLHINSAQTNKIWRWQRREFKSKWIYNVLHDLQTTWDRMKYERVRDGNALPDKNKVTSYIETDHFSPVCDWPWQLSCPLLRRPSCARVQCTMGKQYILASWNNIRIVQSYLMKLTLRTICKCLSQHWIAFGVNRNGMTHEWPSIIFLFLSVDVIVWDCSICQTIQFCTQLFVNRIMGSALGTLPNYTTSENSTTNKTCIDIENNLFVNPFISKKCL